MKLKILLFFIFNFSSAHFSQAMEHKAYEDRIGIVGAGPSGITAAIELKKKGYKNVIVLEASNSVGGKVLTYTHDGKPYELGAVITAPDYANIFSMAQDVDLELIATPPSICCSINGVYCSMLDWSQEVFGWQRYLKLASHHIKFASYVWQHEDFFQPGFSHTPEDMLQNFEPFMMAKDMKGVLEAHRATMSGCGYGYPETMPAPYWMKLMKTFAYGYPQGMLTGAPFFTSFSMGWQTLWQKIVIQKGIDVQLNTKVLKIERTKQGEQTIIAVRTQARNFEFDKLIVSVPHTAMEFMDFDDVEQDIFSKVRTLDYKVTLAKIDGLRQKTHIWLRENSYELDKLGQPNDGKPVLISSNQNTNVYQIYQFTEKNKTSDQLRTIMDSSIQDMGGTRPEIIKEIMFKYFPHFDVGAFKEGVPQSLSRLQGMKGTYYTGALMDFEIVERAAAHGKYVVETYF